MRIQLVAVGLDILRNAQASSSVMLCDSMVTPIALVLPFPPGD